VQHCVLHALSRIVIHQEVSSRITLSSSGVDIGKSN
jgi:hypothetical protein